MYKLKRDILQFQVGEEAKGWLESRMACSSLSEYAKLATIGSLEVVFYIYFSTNFMANISRVVGHYFKRDICRKMS